MDLSFLPPLNACLNAAAALLLVWGRRLARRRQIDRHRRVMLAAFAVSSLFLASYLAHKVWRDFENTTFHAQGLAKTAYLALLASHVVLAASVPVLAITLITLGLRGRFATHRRIARFAWPIWMYVSVTGVVIYLLLYPLNPSPDRAARDDSRGAGFPSDLVEMQRIAASPRNACAGPYTWLIPDRSSPVSVGRRSLPPSEAPPTTSPWVDPGARRASARHHPSRPSTPFDRRGATPIPEVWKPG